MAFPKLEYTRLWTRDSDFARYVDSETQVREDLQYHPDAIATYINDVLLPAMQGTEGAANIGDTFSGTVAETIEDIKNELADQAKDIEDLMLGEEPDSIRAAMVSIGENDNDWAYDAADHSYVLHIPQIEHKRKDSAFGYKLETSQNGKYVTNAWCLLTTSVRYAHEANGDIILTSETPYRGRVVFFGI